jgi:hypothetical protein
MPDFCQTMSSLEQVLKAYEQAGRILPSQYQCQPPERAVAISVRSLRASAPWRKPSRPSHETVTDLNVVPLV